MKRAGALATVAAILVLSPLASATPRATPSQRHERLGVPAQPPERLPLDLTVSQATMQIAKIAAWDVTMQATDCTDPDAGIDAAMNLCERGGIIEVESGPGHSIVESDNTQETIGLWSENQTLGGASHVPQITLAFQYLATHPGYLEWRDDPSATGPDYYSVYNCGWGVRAVMLDEAATGDMAHHPYGVACASHIAANAGMLVGSASAELLDVGPAAWAASGLWAWGDANGDAASTNAAAAVGARVKAWIEAQPSRLASEEWAITGAAAFYGVVESYMKEHPTELAAWVTEFAPKLAGWVDESMPASPDDWTDWRNAFAAWNMLAQFTAAEVLGPKAGHANQLVATDILTKLVAQANPKTGAIAGSQQRPSSEAESWITAYLVYFGLLQVVARSPVSDAGVEGGVMTDARAPDASRPAKDAATALPDSGVDASSQPSAPSNGCSCTSIGRDSALDPRSLLALAAVLLVAARRRART